MLLLDIPLRYEERDLQTPSALSPLYRGWFGGIIQRHCPDARQLGFQLSQRPQASPRTANQLRLGGIVLRHLQRNSGR